MSVKVNKQWVIDLRDSLLKEIKEEKLKGDYYYGDQYNEIIKDEIWMGDQSYHFSELQKKNIKTIINVADNAMLMYKRISEFHNDFKFHHFTISESETINRSIFEEIHKAIDESPKPIYLHSKTGLNRAPCVLMSYLMVKRKIKFREAFKFLLVQRKPIFPKSKNVKALIQLEQELNL